MESASAGVAEAPNASTAVASRYFNLVMIASFGFAAVELDRLAGGSELPFDPLGVVGQALRQPARHLADVNLLFARLETIEDFLGGIRGGHLRDGQHRRHAGIDGAGKCRGDAYALWRQLAAQTLRQAEAG